MFFSFVLINNKLLENENEEGGMRTALAKQKIGLSNNAKRPAKQIRVFIAEVCKSQRRVSAGVYLKITSLDALKPVKNDCLSRRLSG